MDEEPLWSAEVKLRNVTHTFADTWLNFCAGVQHPGLERTETWGIDEQAGAIHTRAEFLIRATDTSAARAIAGELLDRALAAESAGGPRAGPTREVAVRPAPLARELSENATPRSQDYESLLVPTPWHRSEVVEDGRRVKVLWVSGRAPLERVDVQEARDRVAIALFERHPPRFMPDGTPTATSAVAVTKCVEIALKAPLADRLIVDSATGLGPDTVEPGDDGVHLRRAQALAVDLATFPCTPYQQGPGWS